MAESVAALVKVVTATTGTNNYVLQNPGGSEPYRTDVQAVADGSLANGQTVNYVCRDTTVLGDARFEKGQGVYTASTRTVSRLAANVTDGSNGPGVLVTWGLSGQRDFYLDAPVNGAQVTDPATFAALVGLPLLSAANTYTADQKFKKAGAGANIRSGSNVSSLFVDVGRFTFLGHNGSGVEKDAGFFSAQWTDATAASEDSFVRGVVVSAGAAVESFRFDVFGLKTQSGDKYDAFPSGTRLQFGDSLPTGWSADPVTGGSRVVRLAESGDTPGATGGTGNPWGTWETATHGLTVAELAAHEHRFDLQRISTVTGGGATTVVQSPAAPGAGNAFNDTETIGSGTGHKHTIAALRYEIWMPATKDP